MFDINDFKRVEGNRDIEFEWIIAGEGTPKETLAVLRVAHSKAGYNLYNGTHSAEDSFKVSLSNQERSTERGFTTTSFMLFSGLGLGSFPAGNRFSMKKLREAADLGFQKFAALVETNDEQVKQYLNVVVEELTV